jgi:hypothetical protein
MFGENEPGFGNAGQKAWWLSMDRRASFAVIASDSEAIQAEPTPQPASLDGFAVARHDSLHLPGAQAAPLPLRIGPLGLNHEA